MEYLVHLIIFIWTFSSSASQSQITDVYQLGDNPTDGSPAGPTSEDGRTAVYLLNTPMPFSGILYAYSAYFRSSEMLRLQVWRPVLGQVNVFQMVASGDYNHLLVGGVEKIFIESKFKNCIRVLAGDYIGFPVSQNISSPVSYIFKTQKETSSLIGFLPLTSVDQIPANTSFQFSVRTTPYIFSFALLYYTELIPTDDVYPVCLKNLPLEPDATTTLATPPPGVIGPKGQIGPQGDTGSMGFTGSRGNPGPIGSLGDTGSVGDTGLPGPPGYTGPAGATGGTGPSGFEGENGTIGATGPQGPVGDTGSLGQVIILNGTRYENISDLDMWTPAPMAQQQLIRQREWISEPFMIGLLVWLSLLSLLCIPILTILILSTLFYRSYSRHPSGQSKRASRAEALEQINPYAPDAAAAPDATIRAAPNRTLNRTITSTISGRDTLRFSTMPDDMKKMSEVDVADYQLETAIDPVVT